MGNLRFLASVALAVATAGGLVAVGTWSGLHARGGLGIALSVIGTASLGLGIVLSYWVMVDWLNLRVLRKRKIGADFEPLDGDVAAHSGVVRVEGEPLVSPLGGIACAAYTYRLGGAKLESTTRHRGSRRFVAAQGFHLVPTRIVGGSRSLALASFPGFEDDLRADVNGSERAPQARALMDRLAHAPSAGQREREASLLAARHDVVEEVHQDYRVNDLGSDLTLTTQEEALPVDAEVCAIGSYDAGRQALTARRGRMGPNLMLYRGSAEEVLARVGAEAAGFIKTAIALVGVGALLLAHPIVF